MEDWCIEPLVRLARCFVGAEWEQTVATAGRENEWFTAGQVRHAVAALQDEMLRPERLREWLSGYRKPAGWRPGRVGIVMAGNLPLVGFADLAAAVAVGHSVVVKPSSKDRALMTFVVQKLQELQKMQEFQEFQELQELQKMQKLQGLQELPQPGCNIEIVDTLPLDGLDGVIATGGDEARDFFAAQFAGLPTLLRGSRQSVAVLTGRETDQELSGLAEDMFLYWGLGCRSVVRLFVPKGYDVSSLARKLSGCAPFAVAEGRKYAECYRYARAMAAMGVSQSADGGFFVLRRVALLEGPVVPKLAEAFYSEYQSLTEVAQWFAGHEGGIQCVSGAVPEGFPRRVSLGDAQRPAWRDYADGIDTVEFLLGLTKKRQDQ